MRQKGEITVCDPGSDTAIRRAGTAQCVHCSGHFEIVPGSGRVRGWCMNCNGPICGPNCAECIPVDLLLENIEQGRPLNFRPIRVAVP